MSDLAHAEKLGNLRVLVTRSAHQAGGFAERLRRLGADVREIPVLNITKPDDPTALRTALTEVDSYDWVVFASANAVKAFFDAANEYELTPFFQTVSFATIGPATARALEKYGHHARYHPSEFVAESFIKDFPGYPNLEDKRILWPKADIGRLVISEQLTGAGAAVDIVVCYKSSLPENPQGVSEHLLAALSDPSLDAVTLASSQTAKNLQSLCLQRLSEDQLISLLSHVKAVTIGPETSKTAMQVGFKNIEQAEDYTMDGIIDVLLRLADGKRRACGSEKS